ncbi:hypothetical protein L2E82_05013 [Cichorium intybus]|uniref:Uncharacterized protein n=1 Tax=Cichorium intybus TaxID=13427 RepID=A0ACB9H619_CICIN|nr:hypothetical protein L2E82_05013 [Cichorium intybus]
MVALNRQKGIIPALTQLYPCAEHRFCLRHIYDNMKKTWKTREYKDFLWKCATATTIPEFDTCMTEFSQFDRQAFEWLKKIPAQHWARSHFSGRAVSDMLLNNLCEVEKQIASRERVGKHIEAGFWLRRVGKQIPSGERDDEQERGSVRQ